MEKYTKQKVIRVVTECAAAYCDELLDRFLLFIATFRRKKDEEKYVELVYQAKKIDWNKIKFPSEYTYLQELIKR